MKKLLIMLLGFGLAAAMAGNEGFEKKGFLTTKWCVQNDMFKDCRLETAVCGYEGCYEKWKFGDKIKEEMVLYVHDDGKYYRVDLGNLKRSELDEAMNRNEVTLIGSYDKKRNLIHVKEFKAPPPPKKSFFKGCL
ncbi:hypothetical protein [Hydrogenimonas urashimensis]|uniref:hypothetical protein n=1 Tax=Hydrogenimonas urashimensis TaxID=2740515 RepID=UPI0019161273|nr:hypothetical protein [Hydrogenimonas urashimensis]